MVVGGRGSPTPLHLVDAASGRRVALTSHPKWNLEMAHFSPDGGWIAFHTTNAPNVRQIYAVPTRVEGPLAPDAWIPLVTDHGCHPNWSADGSLLYHFSFRDGAFCPWVQRVDPSTMLPSGPPAAVLHLHDPRLLAVSGARATNDVGGGYLYMTVTAQTGNIWMLDQ